jgi:hypothetical protein
MNEIFTEFNNDDNTNKIINFLKNYLFISKNKILSLNDFVNIIEKKSFKIEETSFKNINLEKSGEETPILKPLVEKKEEGDYNDIIFYIIKNSIFTLLCSKLNNYYNKLTSKKIVMVNGLGLWNYKDKDDIVEIDVKPHNYITHINVEAKRNSREFYENNKFLIKLSVKYFIKLIKEYYPNFIFKDNFKYLVQIDIRLKRGNENFIHKDGGDNFLLFIYPKSEPIATTICSNKCVLPKDGKECDDGLKHRSEIKQCEAIFLNNNDNYHCTPYVNRKIDSEKENIAFIRFSLKGYKFSDLDN